MLVNTIKLLIRAGRTVGLREKLDTLYALGRLTLAQYNELCGMIAPV